MNQGLARQIYFPAPYQAGIRDVQLEPLEPWQARVRTLYSGVSAGSELLVYHGGLNPSLPLDKSIEGLSQESSFPCAFAYANVGEIEAVGSGLDTALLGRRVFSFTPHQDYFHARIEDWQLIPNEVPSELATLFPNLETALSIAMDAQVQVGEKVAVLGLGVLGQLTSRLLTNQWGVEIHGLDRHLNRCEISGLAKTFTSISEMDHDYHVLVELSGQAQVLQEGIEHCGTHGRIIVGSWYGDQGPGPILGTSFHRRRIDLVSSQVSEINPLFSSFLDKKKRFEIVWDILRKLDLSPLISHRIPFVEGPDTYPWLSKQAGSSLQVCFEY
ncbi:zinc-dependent alcohol dehydrogenase [Pseudobacteriovorax antillogorgiicola]|nr:zinc-binding alcohol dehydrogenase [Pseudobacteriovorax antillogorgiicola]